ncbi:hypothetical protein Mal52_36990 [Symmachiella dynata]|uniref:Uncharacterized protein n=1 Tax=Symmachiella dynata TaxID=2527995 RepID=A0A517ZRV3_9PLAN|nr:hypothetical protein [Symmachiella dynata]QDU45208.1 hypothetical protein Mal52_36990 [Symmachiella dynata]
MAEKDNSDKKKKPRSRGKLKKTTRDPQPDGPTIGGLLLSLFPMGTNGTHDVASQPRERYAPISAVPQWAPDLFAAMATLLEQSGAYTHPDFFDVTESVFSFEDQCDWKTVGAQLREGSPQLAFKKLDKDWESLASYFDEGLLETKLTRGSDPPKWVQLAIKLLHIADIACAGVESRAFPIVDNPIHQLIYASQQHSYYKDHIGRPERISGIKDLEPDFEETEDTLSTREFENELLPYVPSSICRHVPPYLVCVQPKALTPTVGQTIRSFSHSLALLPPKGVVNTFWFNTFTGYSPESKGGLNLLLVPYPYEISATSFQPCRPQSTRPDEKLKYTTDLTWLYDLADTEDGQVHHLTSGLRDLLRIANAELGHIDGIIFPELALSHAVAERVSHRLMVSGCEDDGQREKEIEPISLFVSGVKSRRFVKDDEKGRNINAVYTRVNLHWHNGEQPSDTNPNMKYVSFRRLQVKHHRWRLDKSQIMRYNIASQLQINDNTNEDLGRWLRGEVWWEDTDVSERECLFWILKNRYAISTLICEDLARIDPVQQVLRAIGPNLVISLLLDGAQASHRWGSRYATSLCDDPGSSVLILTSLGMVRREQIYNAPENRTIGIWKDCFGNSEPLTLPQNAAALAISLSEAMVREESASGREQLKHLETSRKLILSGIRAIKGFSGSKKLFQKL